MLFADLEKILPAEEHIRVISEENTIYFDSTICGDFPPDLLMYTVVKIRPIAVGRNGKTYTVIEVTIQ